MGQFESFIVNTSSSKPITGVLPKSYVKKGGYLEPICFSEHLCSAFEQKVILGREENLATWFQCQFGASTAFWDMLYFPGQQTNSFCWDSTISQQPFWDLD